jgi:pimeloyl-ACP methyl ester carboxylesterase
MKNEPTMSFSKSVNNVDGIAVEYFSPEKVTYPAPLLFVHGSSGGSWIWENFLNYFAFRGWSCYALNLRGHHLSEPIQEWGDVGVAAYLEDIDKVVKWIGRDVVLIGHSMGGILSQKYAEVKTPLKLILLHTAPPREIVKDIDFNAFMNRGKEQGRILTDTVLESDSDAQKLIGYMFDPGNVEPHVLQMCHQRMSKESARALQEMKDVEVDAQKIKCSVYVLGFNLKKIGLNYPIDLSQELARYYSAKDFQTIEPGGHMFMLEKNWEDFAQLIEKWLIG